MPPDDAVRLVMEARAKGAANPAELLVHKSLRMHDARGSIDNVTAIVIFL